jgi:hypothetical protein
VESYPGSSSSLPAIARAQLDRPDESGLITGSAQVSAVFNQPLLSQVVVPNDVGLEVSGFGDDAQTRWYAKGTVVETRSVSVSPLEVGLEFANGDAVILRSRLLLSGVLLLTAAKTGDNLTGTEVRLHLSISRLNESSNPSPEVVGQVTLRGGPGGTATVDRIGDFEAVDLAVTDLNILVPGLPLVKAVFFTGVEIPYEYEATVGEEFQLELIVSGTLETQAQGTGGAAVFGVPQLGLEQVLQRVRREDGGAALSNLITAHVDTTGQAYALDGGSEEVPVAGGRSGACGAAGLPVMGATAVLTLRRGRRRIRRRIG